MTKLEARLLEIEERLLNDSGEVERIPDPDTVKFLLNVVKLMKAALDDIPVIERMIADGLVRSVEGYTQRTLYELEQLADEREEG